MKRRIERDDVRKMRLDGESINVISQKFGVSKSSVSSWCSDIQLTEEQKAKLELRNPALRGKFAGPQKNKEQAFEIREKYKQQGVELARKNIDNIDFAIGLALYWAEGDKGEHQGSVANMDIVLLKKIKCWFMKYFDFKSEELKIKVNAYLDSGLSVDDIKNYWMNNLDLPQSSVKGFTLRSKYYTGLNRKKKMPYGCCTLYFCSVEKKQMILGAIEEFMKCSHSSNG